MLDTIITLLCVCFLGMGIIGIFIGAHEIMDAYNHIDDDNYDDIKEEKK